MLLEIKRCAHFSIENITILSPNVTHDFGHSGDVLKSDVFRLPQGIFA
jgi:hypothetical protein